MANLKDVHGYVDSHADDFIQRLSEAVAIPSVSTDPSRRGDVHRMALWLENQLKRYGVQTRAVPLGQQEVEGKILEYPPAILGRIGDDSKKKTILIYGHFDVQPAEKSDGWDTEPFELHVDRESGKMFGRGSTDDKGPVLGWLNVLEAHHALRIELPVNLRFCFEGLEEDGSQGLDDLIVTETSKGPQGWFHGVDCVCISDNYWLNTRTPCLTYGLRGIAYYQIIVSGPGSDLHSGMGGAVYEPMTTLISLMGKLVSVEGRILIPGVYDGISVADSSELYVPFISPSQTEAYLSHSGGPISLSDDKATVLMGRTREPSLSLHGIEGAYSGAGGKTVIPATVSGKFSLRLVPPQTPDDITKKVVSFIEDEFAKLKTKLKMKVEFVGGGKPWVADTNHWSYEAAKRATETVWGKTPNYTREGGSIPVTLTFADNLGVNVLLLPMGRADDGAHSTNEKLDISNFLNGTKLLGTYLYEVANINSDK
ncbi:unnamed protein product [Somion occarium]|uniref:Peptidase M20 dimerisation domain-containing protein n=1 Tax=Somion occarium TaxID=3059160 RepID=A0ABP1EBM0_9APHY